MILTKDMEIAGKGIVLDDIIENAVGLPLDSLEILLLVAKSMRYTRECLMGKDDKG